MPNLEELPARLDTRMYRRVGGGDEAGEEGGEEGGEEQSEEVEEEGDKVAMDGRKG
jgi:hypothetical protein